MYTELIGIIGGGLYLLAFIEVATGKWNGKSLWYELNNLGGSVLLGLYALKKHAYTNIILNLIWGIFALYALKHVLIRYGVRTKKKKHSHYRQLFNKRNL